MAPYAPASDADGDGRYIAASVKDEESVLFSLTERLREREDEVRQLRREKQDLEKQLLLQGKVKLDVAYEELLTHLKRREEDFRDESKRQEDRLREMGRENRRLRERVKDSRRMLDHQKEGQNRALTATEKVMAQELDLIERRLDGVLEESAEKDRRILALEGLVDRLDLAVKQRDETEGQDKELLARLGDRVENYKICHRELEAANEELARANEDLGQRNEELERRVEMQRRLLKEKEAEVLDAEQFRGQREDNLVEDMKEMRHRYVEIIEAHKDALNDYQEETRLLNLQCEKYETLIDDAEYVTHEQRSALKARKREIEKLSDAIEKAQSSGLFSQLDRMCNAAGSVEVVPGNSLVEENQERRQEE